MVTAPGFSPVMLTPTVTNGGLSQPTVDTSSDTVVTSSNTMDCDYALNVCQDTECCGTARLAGSSSATPLKRCAPRGSTLWIDAASSYQYNFVCDTVLTNTSLPYYEVDTPSHDYVVFEKLDVKEEESETKADARGVGYKIVVIAACLIVMAALGVAGKAAINYFKLMEVQKSGKYHSEDSSNDQEMSKTQLALKKKATQEFMDQYDPNRDMHTNAKLNTETEEEKYDIRTGRKKWKKGDTGGQVDDDNDTIDSNDLNLQPNMNT